MPSIPEPIKIANAAPTQAPLDTPKISGETMGYEKYLDTQHPQ